MVSFGELLRECRQRCQISQERLGELMGWELGLSKGYSAAAVSDWERGKSKINADQRLVLISLIKTLHKRGGLKNSSEANRLLEAGNYRALDAKERENIFPNELMDTSFDVSGNQTDSQGKDHKSPLEKNFSIFLHEWQRIFREAEEGPSPAWPRVGATLLRKLSDYWTVSRLVVAVFWAWVWLLTWWLVAPSLRLPFMSRENAEIVLKLYVVGAFITPLLISFLSNPMQNKFWQEHNLAASRITHLYTYQGAGIGFHLGYFGIFAINLLGYYLQLHFALWFEWLEIGIILLWGYFAARLVPYNLWRAYGRLALEDGWIFFTFLSLGPFWAFFFYQMYPLFLNSIVGGLTVLFAITLLILMTAWRQYRSTLSE